MFDLLAVKRGAVRWVSAGRDWSRLQGAWGIALYLPWPVTASCHQIMPRLSIGRAGWRFVLKPFPFHGPPERLYAKHHFAFLKDSNGAVRGADGNGDRIGRVCDFRSSPMP